MTNRDNLEPIDPSTAQELFLDHKATNCTEATVQNHRYRTNHFLRWCDEVGIDNLNELTGRDIQKYRLWRKEDGDLNKLTLSAQMSTIRVFLKWAASVEAVPENLYDKVLIPQVSPEEQQRDETLDTETAQEILDYLSKYHYASKKHVVMAVFWETGVRIGGAHSLDVEDVDFEGRCLRLEHRPDEGTSLKNGKAGERPIAITPELAEALDDFIEGPRKDVTDDYGRRPLFSSAQGRLARTALRRLVYSVTSPCFRNEPCPDCRQKAYAKCPEAVSPHSIRRGSITHYLSNDVPVEIVSDRMNVSRKVLDKHYDKRSEAVKLEQRRSFLGNV